MRAVRAVARPPETFGARLKRARQERGWTQEDLAFEAGVSQAMVSQYEADRFEPKASSLEALAATLGASLDYLWTGKERGS